ncbi:MAG: hypothetical protein EBY22_04670 [Gammaproteobacteria bacterium]|nr:hypothetical protein [Gammaproteobacteria bacterium]
MPCTARQLDFLVSASSSAWVDSFNLFGSQQITLFSVYPLASALQVLAHFVGLKVAYSLFGGFFVLLALSGLWLLLRDLGSGLLGRLIGAVAYLGGALFFDYFIMGWHYILITFCIIPMVTWTYLRGLRGSRLSLLASGILCAGLCVQPAGMIWIVFILSAVTLSFGLQSSHFKISFAALSVVIIIYALGNAYWIPSIVLYPPDMLKGNYSVNHGVSNAMSAHYLAHNALRGWGALFNFQFETIQNRAGLGSLSIFYSVLALIGLIFSRNSLRLAFGICFTTPLFLLFLLSDRTLIAVLPFANVFRDVARFAVISIFGMAVLAGLGSQVVVDYLKDLSIHWRISFSVIFVVIVCGTTFPWWSGSMFNWRDTTGPDIRIRSKHVPSSFLEIEELLSKQNLVQKSILYPVGGLVSFSDDIRFKGAYQETQDVFGFLSNMPGHFSISDKENGPVSAVLKAIALNTPTVASLDYLSRLGVRLFIFRKNLTGLYETPSEELVKKMVDSGRWRLWFKNADFLIYAASDFYPRIFLGHIGGGIDNDPQKVVEYRKLSPTQYVVRVHGVMAPFDIYLGQSFSEFWTLSGVRIPATTVSSAVGVGMVTDEMSAGAIDMVDFVQKGWISLPKALAGSDTRRFQSESQYISRSIKNSIQNDYLPGPDQSFNIRMSNYPTRGVQHGSGNGAENVWTIDPVVFCGSSDFCKRYGEDSMQLDLLIDFQPQKVFYFGGIVSFLCYFSLFIYFIYYIWRIQVGSVTRLSD